jgi:hypothetical protein
MSYTFIAIDNSNDRARLRKRKKKRRNNLPYYEGYSRKCRRLGSAAIATYIEPSLHRHLHLRLLPHPSKKATASVLRVNRVPELAYRENERGHVSICKIILARAPEGPSTCYYFVRGGLAANRPFPDARGHMLTPDSNCTNLHMMDNILYVLAMVGNMLYYDNAHGV